MLCQTSTFISLHIEYFTAYQGVATLSDMYKEGSIKEMKRQMRGTNDILIISGPLTKKPADWKTFLMNSENKSQLVDVMNDVWFSHKFADVWFSHKFAPKLA